MDPSSDAEPFTLVTESKGQRLFDDYQEQTSAKLADLDIQLTTALRAKFPEMIVTVVPQYVLNLKQFAAAGNASAELDTTTDSTARWRWFFPGSRRGTLGQLAEAVFFAKYHYHWNNEDFIVYTVGNLTYILKEPTGNETTMSHSKTTDALLYSVGSWQYAEDYKSIYVFDGYWQRSRDLWDQVQKASWDNVILDGNTKKALTEVSERFFDSEDVYKGIGVPWKRGLIFWGPAGNGKTISIKALMHTLYDRVNPIPTMYVKSAPTTWSIRNVFVVARAMAPCLLILEDIDTIVTPQTRSYFFNEVDGLENNDGILMVASTNHLDQLDPGLSKRPSRFDRKYLFPLPSQAERVLYCGFWREKLKIRPTIIFPKKLCIAIAGITQGFSFAYMQEAFVATLLVIAGNRSEDSGGNAHEHYYGGGDDDDDLDDFELWREIKKQVKILRDDMDSSNPSMELTTEHFPIAPEEPGNRDGVPQAEYLRTNPFRDDPTSSASRASATKNIHSGTISSLLEGQGQSLIDAQNEILAAYNRIPGFRASESEGTAQAMLAVHQRRLETELDTIPTRNVQRKKVYYV
ncbi:MAG: hypothetical protein M1827_003750 [Pycnora praestabilis]|nr:MAG: hypothetical protein M1827_003750 [Pycnora praestabilis]